MSGNKAILDSNLLIFLSKEMIDRRKLYSRYDEFCVSIITYMEVYAFDFPDKSQKDLLDETFANLEIIELNREIADQAVVYRKNKSRKIKLPEIEKLSAKNCVRSREVSAAEIRIHQITNRLIKTWLSNISTRTRTKIDAARYFGIALLFG